MARPAKRFTIYDKMEADGAFDTNPANQQSRDPITGLPIYKGPVQYPKMLYHPLGEMRVVRQAEPIATPLGVKMVGQQEELIYQVVGSPEEEEALRKQGWHASPARALQERAKQRGEPVPEIPADSFDQERMAASSREEALLERIRQLEIEKAELENGLTPKAPAVVKK